MDTRTKDIVAALRQAAARIVRLADLDIPADDAALDEIEGALEQIEDALKPTGEKRCS